MTSGKKRNDQQIVLAYLNPGKKQFALILEEETLYFELILAFTAFKSGSYSRSVSLKTSEFLVIAFDALKIEFISLFCIATVYIDLSSDGQISR